MSFLQLQAQAELELRRRRRGGRTPTRRLALRGWTEARRAQLKPGVAFDLAAHRYLRAIYEDDAQVVVVYKAGQMGASEYLISYALHACDQRQATALYVFPTDTHVSDFSSARLGPALEVSPYLSRIVVEGGDAKGKRGADRVTLKRVRDRFLYFRGAKVTKDGRAPQLKSVDADVLILDEVDEMDPRAPSIAVKRLGHSLIAEERWVSTPSYPGIGIHQKWQETDQREWHIACGTCGERQPLTIDQVVTEWDDLERPVVWHGQGEGRAYIACRHCGAELERTGAGEWVPACPGRHVVGYHLSHLFSAQVSLLDTVVSLQTTDETKRKEAFNQDLGLPYTPRGGGLDSEVLDACRRDYAHGISHAPGARAVMGVDVGKMLHVVIRSAPNAETGERRQLFAGAVSGFDEVVRLIRLHRVATCVVDALPETRQVREFQAELSDTVWLAYYVQQAQGTKDEEPASWDADEGVVNLDRTRTLDETLARFVERENTLPAHIRDVADYYEHLKAPVRVVEKLRSGDLVARYVETGPDHYAHAENYCTVAGMRPRVPEVRVRWL